MPGSSENLVCLRSPSLAQVPGCVPEGFLRCPRLSSEVLTVDCALPDFPAQSLSLTPWQPREASLELEPPSPAQLQAAHEGVHVSSEIGPDTSRVPQRQVPEGGLGGAEVRLA